eukprot:363525-Chlamydomonas_euryale.AAC.5
MCGLSHRREGVHGQCRRDREGRFGASPADAFCSTVLHGPWMPQGDGLQRTEEREASGKGVYTGSADEDGRAMGPGLARRRGFEAERWEGRDSRPLYVYLMSDGVRCPCSTVTAAPSRTAGSALSC